METQTDEQKIAQIRKWVEELKEPQKLLMHLEPTLNMVIMESRGGSNV